MAVVLTGGTGLVGSAVLRALLDSGHDVTAIVRSDASAATVTAAGATAVVGDLTDHEWLTAQFASADGAIHTASPGDATSADFDTAVVRAAIAAYAGTDKTYVHTGGVWVHGEGTGITENTPLDAPELTSWRKAVEDEVSAADLRTVIVEPGIVYTDGGQGLAALITRPTDSGEFRLVGDGTQHWTTVRADELADLYVKAFDNPEARGHYLGVNDDHPTVREIVQAAAGSSAVVEETPDESRSRLFAPLVDALLLDQSADNGKARTELGWTPSGRSLLDEIAAR